MKRAWVIGMLAAAVFAVGSGGSASAALVGPPTARGTAVNFERWLVGSVGEATVHFTASAPVGSQPQLALPFVTESVGLIGGESFSIVRETCSGSEPRSACEVTVQYQPLRPGDDASVLRLDTLSGTTDVPFTGKDARCCRLTVHDATGREGDDGATDLPIVVHRDGPSDYPVTFSWRTIEGTAGQGDVTPIGETTTTMPAGVVDLALPIEVLPDDVHEETEALTVELLSSTDAIIGSPSVATGTIDDDDPLSPPEPPRPTITAEGTEVVERDEVDTILTVPVTLPQPVTVDTTYWVTEGPLSSASPSRDHEPLPGFLFATAPAGSNVARVSIRVLGDARPEDVETIHLQLKEPFSSGVAAQTLVSVVDDDAARTVAVTPTRLGPISLSGLADLVAWRGGAPTGVGTLELWSQPRPEAPRLTVDLLTGARLTDLTALSMRTCRAGADAPEVEIAMTSGHVLRAGTNGGVDAWQTFDGVDRLVWMDGSRPTSLAQYQADFPADRIATASIILPSAGSGGYPAYVDRLLVGTTSTPVQRFDLEPSKGTPKTVRSGTCQASPVAAGGAGGGLPGTG